jgi:hypothetical protein
VDDGDGHIADELVHTGKKKTGAQEGSSPCCGVLCGENDVDDAEMVEIEDGWRSGKEARERLSRWGRRDFRKRRQRRPGQGDSMSDSATQ